MALSSQRIGESSIVLGAIIRGFFPIIAVLTFNFFAPLASLAFSLIFATGFFAVILTWKRKWHELKKKEALLDILGATLIISIIFYCLYYIGLRYTSPGNASIISLLEIFFSYLIFHCWQKHYISKLHIFGASLIPIGALIILFPNLSNFQLGDFLVLSAVFAAPFGNYFQQRARKKVSSETILFIRSAISLPIIILLSAIFEKNIFSPAKITGALPFLLINGLAAFGLAKIFWIEGIHRISVTKAAAMASIAPLITILIAWAILGQIPTAFQLLAIIPMGIGLILLSVKEKRIVEMDAGQNKIVD